MLLSALTPDELERLAFVQPAHPGVATALARVAYRELGDAQENVAYLENEVQSLCSQLDEKANEE